MASVRFERVTKTYRVKRRTGRFSRLVGSILRRAEESENGQSATPTGAHSRGRDPDALGTVGGDVVPALDGLDLTIHDGEFFTFVGPSGCGKSTALHLVAGLDRETEGRLLFDDVPVSHLEPKDRDVALVFQSYALYPHMTVRENVSFPLRVRRCSRREVEAAVDAVAGSVGIRELLDRQPRALSGGQRQRVALARALVRRPRVFLLDEPLSNLDARLRLEMRSEIKRIHAEFGITTVYVTHDQEEALAVSQRMAVMHRGRLQQCGTPDAIYHAPANRFVASFIGSPPINFIEGGPLARLLPTKELFRGHDPDTVVVGLRPEALRVGPGAEGGLGGTVRSVETTGRDRWADVDCEGHVLRGKVEEGADVGRRDSVLVRVPRDRALLFDRRTELLV